jgi:hypothetical protein
LRARNDFDNGAEARDGDTDDPLVPVWRPVGAIVTAILLATLVWALPPVTPSEIYWPDRIVRIC